MAKKEVDDLSQLFGRSVVRDNSGILSFEGQGIKLDDKASAKTIVKAIEEFQDLKVLVLKGNTLGIEASESIGIALEKHPGLKRALWSDLFTGRLKSEIPEALKNLCKGLIKSNSRLTELDLSDNAFGPNGMNGLVDFLSSPSCHDLQELRLNNNGLGTTGGKMLADSLNKCYESSLGAGRPLSLKTFVSGRGRLENEGATALSVPFKKMASLQEVSMPQNGILFAGITSLAQSLAFNPALRILNLSDNTFTRKGSLAMAKALKKLSNLEEVNFEDCLIRTSGAVAIGNALKKSNPNLKVLNLSGNEIKLAGALAVVEAVVEKKYLKSLNLNANCLGGSGIEQITSQMRAHNKIEALEPFDDDEGTEDEEEEDVVEGSEDEEEEDDGGQSNASETYSPQSSPDNKAIESFLCQPTMAAFKDLLKRDKCFLNNYLEDIMTNLDQSVICLMKLASLCYPVDNDVNQEVFPIADIFLKKVFDDVSFSWVANSILISIGLLKDEEKKRWVPKNLNGCLVLLQHVCAQDYFHRDAKRIVRGFISTKKDMIKCQEDLLTDLLDTLS